LCVGGGAVGLHASVKVEEGSHSPSLEAVSSSSLALKALSASPGAVVLGLSPTPLPLPVRVWEHESDYSRSSGRSHRRPQPDPGQHRATLPDHRRYGGVFHLTLPWLGGWFAGGGDFGAFLWGWSGRRDWGRETRRRTSGHLYYIIQNSEGEATQFNEEERNALSENISSTSL
jgi:hypothetical protein